MKPEYSYSTAGYAYRNTTKYESNEGDEANDFEAKLRDHVYPSKNQNYISEMENYIKNPIPYKYNNYGFRGEDIIDGEEYNVFLGCSHTQGVGHYYENGWAYQLNKWLGDAKLANMSSGGNGIASGFRHLNYFSNRIKVKRVFVFFPHWYRFEVISDDAHGKPTTVNPKSSSFNRIMLGNIDKKNTSLRWIYTQDDFLYHYYLSNALAILAICNELDVPMYFKPYNERGWRSKPEYTDLFYPRDWHGSTWAYNGVMKMFKNEIIQKNIATTTTIRDSIENTQLPVNKFEEPLFDYKHNGGLYTENIEDINSVRSPIAKKNKTKISIL